jgi:DNA-binding MarR family transcriptional regulator
VQAKAANRHVSAAELAKAMQLFMHELMRGSGAVMVRILEELDLSLTHMKVLHILADADDDLSVKELAEHIGISLPGASRTVDGLLKRGYLARREDAEDRRIKRLTLTPEGRDALDTLERARLQGIERYLHTLSPEQRAALSSALSDLPHRI